MAFASPEDKFGIKLRSRPTRSLEQNTAMIMGSVYIVGGIIGFFSTGFSHITERTTTTVLWIFMVNPYHNIVHIAVGSLWLMGAFALTQAGTEGLNIAIGGVYILATVLGFLGYLYLLNIPTTGGDNYLHLVSGTIPLIFGSGLLRAFGGRETATA